MGLQNTTFDTRRTQNINMNVSGALLSRIRKPSSIIVQKQLLIIPGCQASTKTGHENDDILRRRMIEKIIRGDHAGEMGASFIYQGQMAVLKNHPRAAPLIQEMWEHEKAHLAKFEELLKEYKVTPTILIPLWKLAGFTLGAGCALLGESGAMACTVAVEDLVTKHYDQQVMEMVHHNPSLDTDLILIIQKFRDDEQHHLDLGLAHGAEDAPFYNILTKIINFGCRNAIWISEKI